MASIPLFARRSFQHFVCETVDCENVSHSTGASALLLMNALEVAVVSFSAMVLIHATLMFL